MSGIDHQVGVGPWSDLSRWIVVIAISTGAFMANIDTTAVAVALPTIADEFGVGLDSVHWVVSAYLLTITAVLPSFARLADIVGRKRVLSIGMAIFVTASGFVAAAPTFELLIAARAAQGVGGAMFMSTIISTAVSAFPDAQRGQVLGVISSTVAAGTVLGPGLGGLLTGAFGWRSIFLINLPIGAAGLIGTLLLLPRHTVSTTRFRRFDFPGAITFAAAASGLLLAAAHGPGSGWNDSTTLVPLGASLAMLAVFIAWELRASDPLVELRLFTQRVFGLGTLASFLCYVLTIFPAILFPIYLQEVLGWSTSSTGAVLVLQAVAMLLVAPLAGSWSDRRGSKSPTIVALGLVVVTMAATTLLGGESEPWLVCLLLLMFGAAFGLFITPNNSAVVGDVSPTHLGVANGTIATVRNAGRAVGVAAVVTVYQFSAHTADMTTAPADVLLNGFRGAFVASSMVAGLALATVIAMHRRGRTC